MLTSPELVPRLGFRTDEGGGNQLHILNGAITVGLVTVVVVSGGHARNGRHVVAAVRDFTKHGMLSIQPVGGAVVGDEEELATAGVGIAGLGH